MAKWGFVLFPLVVMLLLGWYNVATAGSCMTDVTSTGCSIDASKSVFVNPLGFIASGFAQWNPPTSAASAWNDFWNWGTRGVSYVTTTVWSWFTGNIQGAATAVAFMSGLALITFAIFGNFLGATFSVNMTGDVTRFLIALGIGQLLWGWLTGLSPLLTSAAPTNMTIPYGIGNVIFAVLYLCWAIGWYDIGRTII